MSANPCATVAKVLPKSNKYSFIRTDVVTQEDRMIIDSKMSVSEALSQNPSSAAPPEIIEHLRVLTVQYIGFDDLLHQGQIVMHEALADDVQQFFKLAIAYGFPIQRVIPISSPAYEWNDERSCMDNNSSGFNYRLIAGTNELSKHARGLAFDINPLQNVYIRYDGNGKEIDRLPANAQYEPDTPGTLTTTHFLVRVMRQRGWIWGGDWTPDSGRVDYQHFEKVL